MSGKCWNKYTPRTDHLIYSLLDELVALLYDRSVSQASAWYKLGYKEELSSGVQRIVIVLRYSARSPFCSFIDRLRRIISF